MTCLCDAAMIYRQHLYYAAFLLALGVFSDVDAVDGSQFRGGTITWSPSVNYNTTFREVTFSFRLSWERSQVRCDDELISSGKLIGNNQQEWSCSYGCDGPVGPTSFRCASYSEEKGFSEGFNTFQHVFINDGPFAISYLNCCWMTTNVTDSSSQWQLTTNLLLGVRSDTNNPNHAPVVHTPLTLSLRPGVASRVRLNISDQDNDITRCRLGTSQMECGSVCFLPPIFTLNQENCELSFHPSSNDTGLFALSLVVEDFHRESSNVTVGEGHVRANQPISAVPFHFIIDVGEEASSNRYCIGVRPEVRVARSNGDSSVVRTSNLFHADVIVHTCDETRVSQIELSGPLGTSRSAPVINDDGMYQVTLSWRPSTRQLGLHSFCATAVLADGLRSDRECFTVFVDAGLFYCRGIDANQYITFDGMQYSFVGACQYQLAMTTFSPALVSEQNLEPFNITVWNEMGDGKARPSTSAIHVTVAKQHIELQRHRRIMINGARAYLPIRLPGISIDLSGRFVVMATNTGISLRYDGFSSYVIILPHQYSGHVTGLCGNFNSKADDEFQIPDNGGLPYYVPPHRYAAYFQVDTGRCQQAPQKDVRGCRFRRRMLNSAVCGLLTEKSGCFAGCHDLVEPIPFFESCMTALCNSAYSVSTLEAQVAAYADACQVNTAHICNWRQRIGATLECAPNSHYNPCGSSRAETCTNLNAEEDQPGVCVEGCECDEGFVLSGDSCVPNSLCGCFIQGSYRLPGFTYRTSDCAFECSCVEQNQTTCAAASPCGGNERCGMMENGLYGCAVRSKAPSTCKIFREPHYITFDGASYDSTSTCPHVLVRSKSDSLMVPFSVIGVNTKAGPNSTDSYVKEVQVTVGGSYNLYVILGQGSLIKLNGDVINPGSSFKGLQFRMTSSFVVVTFDFGLVIRWDGTDRLRISAWGPLRGQVEGLCGNYDGDPSNDFVAENSGGLITNIADFINSWIVTGKDENRLMFPKVSANATEICMGRGFSGKSLDECRLIEAKQPRCRERVHGELPCEGRPEQLEKSRHDCYVLVDPQGPFAPCHSVFDPFNAYTNCVFDLCTYEGNSTLRERILSSFDYDCREHNATLTSWRSSLDTPMICGENSVYSECMSQCVDACDDPEGRRCLENMDIGEFCEEGCQCLDGYVRSHENKCITKEECGCIIHGLYQLPGFTYRENNCSSECECIGDGRITCRPAKPCLIRLTCQEDEFGFQRCDGRLRRRATCKAVTDPHYMTFDGTRYDSMGTCAYTMVRNRVGSPAPNFHVIAVNENPLPGQIVSHVRDVIVLFGENQTMTFHQRARVTLNGVQIFPGTEIPGFVVRRAGRFIVVEFDFRLVIRWDGQDRLRVSAWQPLRNMVEGLCGDFDDDPSNDFQTSWGEVTTDLDTFVRSWEVQGYNTTGCVLPPPQNITEVCQGGENLARYGRECSILTDPKGPFSRCHEEVSPWPSYRDCIYDLCIYNGSTAQKDRIFTSYIADCEGENLPPNTDWREEANLTTVCPEHMHYNVTSSPCQPTCSDRDGSRCMASQNRDSDIEEGCECDDRYVLSGDICVPEEECGCIVDGRYFPRGFVQRNEDCSQECVCIGNNVIRCDDAPPCSKRSKCKTDKDGFRRCVMRPRRRATCKAVTDPHYMTFDGTTYDSMGMCSYIMVQSKANASALPFRVIAVNQQPEPHRIVSHVKEVFVHYGDNMTMHFAARKVIKLNGVMVNPGFKKDGIEIRTAGRFTVVHWEWGLVVRWDGEDRLRISAWAPLRYQLEGLCGDFDDNPENDLTSPTGEFYPDIEKFVNSWIIEGYGAEGCPEGTRRDPTPSRCDDQDTLNMYRNACYVIIDPDGPMKDCQPLAEAQTAFNACVFDQCAYDGDPLMKDRIISSYLDTCLDEDEENREDNDTDTMKPPVWRPAANLTDPDCPLNSHYNSCMSQCQPSCDDPDGSICSRSKTLGHACVDGCEANDGYLLSGGVFVTPYHCGCMVDGTYYMDEQSFLTATCDTICHCNEGNVSCRSTTGCHVNQECRPDDAGILACLPYRIAACERSGNGHFLTFDKLSYSFTGACEHIFAQSVSNPGQWAVKLETEITDMGISSVRTVTIYLANLTIITRRVLDVIRIEVNSIEISNFWSRSSNDTELSVQTNGRFAIFTSSMGMRLEFDGNQLILSLPYFMRNQVTGLCGNFNGDASDDWSSVNGSIASTVNDFVSSYQTRECPSHVATTQCSEKHSITGRSANFCGLITNTTGPLRPCNRVIPFSTSRRHFEQCVSDYCTSGGNRTVLEQAIQSYIHECLKQGVRICEWRETTGFITSCPLNMHYDGCASSCPSMCGQVPQDSSCGMLESCVCDDGYILQDGVCLPMGSCRCAASESDLFYGNSFTSSDCAQTCTCYGQNVVTCRETSSCKANEMCGETIGNNFVCVKRPKVKASCTSVNGQHFTRFDGTHFDWPATCDYVMVRSRSIAGRPSFIITASYIRDVGSNFSKILEISLQFDGHLVVMFANGSVQLDSQTLYPGFSTYDVEFRQDGDFHVVALPFGLVVRWNMNGSLIIHAWRNQHGLVEGLCGEFSDETGSDVIRNAAEFVSQWEGKRDSCSGRVTRVIPDLCDLKAARDQCRILTSVDGPYGECHELLSPEYYYESCVLDFCLGDPNVIDRIIGSYARDCVNEGGSPNRYPLTTNGSISCPMHSVYSACASQCRSTCLDRSRAGCHGSYGLEEECVEGCQCDNGYVVEGDRCIDVHECGCVTPGGERMQVYSSVLTDNCTMICRCRAGNLTCYDTSCYPDQYCGIRGGEYGCHWIDECEYENGGCSHSCDYNNGVASCSCPPGYSLNRDNKTCSKNEDEELDHCEERAKQAAFTEWTNKLITYVDTIRTSFNDPQTVAHVCGNRWSEWLDRDDPGGLGDEESLELLQIEYPHSICKHPVAIEARLSDGRPATASGNDVEMSAERGLRCMNARQADGIRCADFQVRFLCLSSLF